MSNNRANASASRTGRAVVTVVPVTSNVARVFQAEQVRSVTVERVGPVLGHVLAQVMGELDEALRLHLQL